jgi:hypothetical protein
MARLQADNHSALLGRQDAECRAAATLEENNSLLGQVSDLEQERKQLQEDKQHLEEDKKHLQAGAIDTAKVSPFSSANASCYKVWVCLCVDVSLCAWRGSCLSQTALAAIIQVVC